MNQLPQSSPAPLPAGPNKLATWSMWTSFGSVLCGPFLALPAIVLGIVALRSSNRNGRGRAWVGIVMASILGIGRTVRAVVSTINSFQEEAAKAAQAKATAEAAKVAMERAKADAPTKVEEARAAVATGNIDSAVHTVEWLRSFNLDVPTDLGIVFAKDRLTKAKAAATEKRWEEARKLAGEAKGAGAPSDGEAAQLMAKATAALDKAAAVERATAEKAAAEKVAAQKRERSVEESCSYVSRKFGEDSSLSELQKDEDWKNWYKGKEFSWRLEVVEVDTAALGGFTVLYKCAQNSPSITSDVIMSYPKSAKSEVMALKKGHSYAVRGRFTRTSTTFGLSAEPLEEAR